jgi:hypothetical protein
LPAARRHSLARRFPAAINRYLGDDNRKPTFVWIADPDRIIEKMNRRY